MRPIKFRVWNGEYMVSPDYIDREGLAHWSENSIPQISKEVMQFTGRKDNHGKEIYEDDIMDRFPLYKGQITKTVVKWNKVNACFDGCFGEEVIGNVFENPELLDVKKGDGK